MIIKSAEFTISNTEISKCPTDNLPEFAFIGRSNVGKSSLINMLVNQKNLAKASSTPGKTKLINHFLINKKLYFVDLPGYGFAKVSKSIKEKWEAMIKNYILKRDNLFVTFILIDIRIKPCLSDLEFMQWLGEKQKPFIITFTKTDKLSKRKLKENLTNYSAELEKYWAELPIAIVTSSETKLGKEDIFEYIEQSIKQL